MPQDMKQVWKDLKKKGELAHCKHCGKKIWKFWKVIERRKINGTNKYPEMDECGPCHFDR